jgi:hypothetical protein
MPLSDWIRYDTRSGQPYRAGAVTLTPFVRSLEVRFPWLRGGFEWSRPVSVLAQSQDGREEVIPIHDLTRLIQISILISGLVSGISILRAARKRKSKQEATR